MRFPKIAGLIDHLSNMRHYSKEIRIPTSSVLWDWVRSVYYLWKQFGLSPLQSLDQSELIAWKESFREEEFREFYNDARYIAHLMNFEYGEVRRTSIRRVIDLVESSGFEELSIMDVGVGNGSYLKPLVDRFWKKIVEMSYVDMAKPQILITKHRVADCGVLASASNLPYRDESFNIIICLDVMEHLKDPSAALGEIGRILRRRGMAILNHVSFDIVPYREKAHISPLSQAEFEEMLGRTFASVERKEVPFNVPMYVCSN